MFQDGLLTAFGKLIIAIIFWLLFILADWLCSLTCLWFKKVNSITYKKILKDNYSSLMNNINKNKQRKVNKICFNIFDSKLKFWKKEIIICSILGLASFILQIVSISIFIVNWKELQQSSFNVYDFVETCLYFCFLPIFTITNNLKTIFKIYTFFSIKKILIEWKDKNDKLPDELLIENTPDVENKEMLEVFVKFNLKLERTIENSNFKTIVEILKSCQSYEEFCNEFYFCVVCNYQNISVNGVRFEKENFSWLWKNREYIYEHFFKNQK
ncbi:hypothetical protein MBVG596_1164 [Mycoplasmopsis bovigenitalium]|uniref:MAG0920 family protein n=1 Tax=Mycoplasmopsis bovigenitalium TaxID=2112 RepID=UPI000909509A|nr:hypothetical protein [Mycoplasmopsis bovigenitalium]BAW18607.1 hypothetical protein MBVG596_1164 [Mycoplasmopsis bovigenitalium]